MEHKQQPLMVTFNNEQYLVRAPDLLQPARFKHTNKRPVLPVAGKLALTAVSVYYGVGVVRRLASVWMSVFILTVTLCIIRRHL